MMWERSKSLSFSLNLDQTYYTVYAKSRADDPVTNFST
jgi:hypothetical protein